MEQKEIKFKSPSVLHKKYERITEATDIADEFNCYFTETGPKLTAIDPSGKPPFDSYLTKPCLPSFKFEYTNPDRVEKIIGNLKQNSSAGLENISSKILKEFLISYRTHWALWLISRYALGYFLVDWKLPKFCRCLKKTTIDSLEIIAAYRSYPQCLTFSRESPLTNCTITLYQMIYYLMGNTGSEINIPQNWLLLS